MTRGWPVVLAAAALAAGCGTHRPAGGDRDALDYATAYYRGTLARLLWPRSETLTGLAARASCRTAHAHYRIDDSAAFAAEFARRAAKLDRAHRIPSSARELATACGGGIERPQPG